MDHSPVVPDRDYYLSPTIIVRLVIRTSAFHTYNYPEFYTNTSLPSYYSARKMAKPIEITSPEQFSETLKGSRIVVADCKYLDVKEALTHRTASTCPAINIVIVTIICDAKLTNLLNAQSTRNGAGPASKLLLSTNSSQEPSHVPKLRHSSR